ncbi:MULTISPECIES: outer membrane beta-barrel protein [Niastella]|uniref:Outer membrane beta-barrel protein n=1 Tax=Niastella soli TaxID=2821487 RepID=A0ABS3YND6_9BACT|nr:outer membrane beta-barrel protein [Niastella soli]MBO9199401.1 outer membrane beta-barrel protein [Niastella soli]
MKKFTLSILLLSAIIGAKAQTESPFKPFKVDVSLGYAIPGGEGAKGGVLFVVEPKYEVIPNLSVGLRMEAAVMARGIVDANGNAAEASVKAAGSYLLTGDYYFTQTTVRPFAGAGLGIFSLASADVTSNGSTASVGGGSKFGEMVRAGVELSHFRVGLEYNIIPSTKIESVNGSGVKTTYSSKNGYMGIKLGFVIGGGKK